jgi:hypothetical protein
MKLATRISSIRRIAWKQCRSWSPASLSMWPDSDASSRLAGWIRSPPSSSSLVTGSWASQSTSRSGCSPRSSRAMAMSRRACPSPIGEDRYSARRRRRSARVQRSCRDPADGATRSAKSRSSRLTLTGSRACGPCPEPSTMISEESSSSASATPHPGSTSSFSVPWRTRVEQRTRAHRSTTVSGSAPCRPSRGSRPGWSRRRCPGPSPHSPRSVWWSAAR